MKGSTIENLPINGRDYTILARLSTGVVPPQPGARAPLMFSANGVRPAQNNYLLDGIDNNTSNVDFLSGVAYIVKPPVDAVDEIKDHDELVQRRVRPRRRSGAQHNPQVGDEQISRERLGVLP